MRIAFGATSFNIENFAEGECFTASDSIKCKIEKITDEYCEIYFDADISKFTHKYPMPYRLLDKYEQLELF